MRTALVVLLLVSALGTTAAEVEIVNVFPVAGSVGGGDLVEISVDLNYVDRCDPFPCYTNPDVFFGDAPAEVVTADDRRIVVRTPPHAPGAVTVRVHIA